MSEQWEAGRELDAEVATRVMGWYREVVRETDEVIWWAPNPHGRGRAPASVGDIPPYSSDVAAAMLLLEGWQDYDIQRRNGWFTVEVYEPSSEYRAHAETLPLAICRAALAACAPVEGEGRAG